MYINTIIIMYNVYGTARAAARRQRPSRRALPALGSSGQRCRRACNTSKSTSGNTNTNATTTTTTTTATATTTTTTTTTDNHNHNNNNAPGSSDRPCRSAPERPTRPPP